MSNSLSRFDGYVLTNGTKAQDWIKRFPNGEEREIAEETVDRCIEKGIILSELKLRIKMSDIKKERYQSSYYSKPSPQASEVNYYMDSSTPQTIIIQYPQRKSNGWGVAGFVFAVLSLVLLFIPLLGFVSPAIGVLGLLLSFIGLFKAPRGFAIAGFCITLIMFAISILGAAVFLSILEGLSK